MHEIGYWNRPKHRPGARHIVKVGDGELRTYCGAHKQLVDGVNFIRTSQVISAEEVTCGHCRRRLRNPEWCLEHLGVSSPADLEDGQK